MRRLGLVLMIIPLLAFGQERTVSKYDVVAKGLRVGHVTTERSRVERDGQSLVRCEITTEVGVNLLFFRYSLTSHEISFADESGIIEYERTATEDAREMSVRGFLKDSVFHFDIDEAGAKRVADIPRGNYDFASLDAPEQHLKLPGETRSYRVLSVDRMCVVDRAYTLVRRDAVKVGGQKTDCQVVEFSDRYKSARRWFTMDDLGLCIFRQEGKDEAGAYTLRMTDNTVENIPVISSLGAEEKHSG